jgi:hypothetical protein
MHLISTSIESHNGDDVTKDLIQVCSPKKVKFYCKSKTRAKLKFSMSFSNSATSN